MQDFNDDYEITQEDPTQLDNIGISLLNSRFQLKQKTKQKVNTRGDCPQKPVILFFLKRIFKYEYLLLCYVLL